VARADRPVASPAWKGTVVTALAPEVLVANEVQSTLSAACGAHPGVACRLVWDLSQNATAAKLVDDYLAGPINVVLRVCFVVILALVIRTLTHRLITRLTSRAAEGTPSGRKRAQGTAAAQLLFTERRKQRAYALGSILRSISSAVIFGIAAIYILGDLGLNLAPVLASAGVVGVAVGFGAQSLVRDFLSGIFMLVEDQYGVGDVIDVGAASGTVETVGLRVTRLRDINGVVWHVRNGAIDRIGNESQGWSRAVIDLPVDYDQDIPRVREIMKEAARAMWAEPRWQPVILEEPEVWGVQALSGKAVVMRLVAKTVPLRQWEVARELRERLKAALDMNHVPLAALDGSA
jgi:small conductance mechanosensitive channel